MKNKLQLGLLLLLFLIPPIAAYVLFYSDFRPDTGANHGQLIQPVIAMGDANLKTVDGRDFKLDELDGKWTLLYLGSAECGDVCNSNLYKIHQVRLAQGKNIGRVSSVYIRPLPDAAAFVDEVGKVYPGLQILLVAESQHLKMIERFSRGVPGALQPAQHVYIVDPVGNIMMFYHADADPTGIRKDLKRLLKISQLG